MAKKLFLGNTFQAFDNNGDPLAGGKVYFYEPGTTTLKNVYTDSTLSVVHSNPVILDANGRAAIWLLDSYKVVVKDSTDVVITEEDNVNQKTVSTVNQDIIVVNGSFELDTIVSGQPDYWSITPTATGTIAIDTVINFSGLQSLRFTSVDATGAGVAKSQLFDLSKQSEFDLRFTYYSSAANTGNAITLTEYNAAGTVLLTTTLYNNTATNPTSWTEKIVRFKTNAQTVRAELNIEGMKTTGTTTIGDSGFDAVSITNLTENAVVKTTHVTNAINEITVSDAATLNKPSINQTGTDFVGIDIENIELQGGKLTATEVQAPAAIINEIAPIWINGNLLLSGNGIGFVEIGTQRVYGMKRFDTPLNLVSSSAILSTWTAVTAPIGAKIGIVQVHNLISSSIGGTLNGTVYLRPTGGIGSASIPYMALVLRDQYAGTVSPWYSEGMNVYLVNLSSSYQFDWYASISGSGTLTSSVSINLLGYYT